MNVQVNYTTQLKAALGCGSESITLRPPATVSQLLRELAQIHGESFRHLVLDDQGQPLPSILICIGDQQVDSHTAAELKDGDQLTILSAISGG